MPNRSQTVPTFWSGPEEEHRRKMAHAINALMKGQGNNGFAVTLTPDAVLTELEVEFARPGNIAQLQPMSASAAASLASVWTEVEIGRVNLHHDSQPAADRRYGVVLVA
jgi:hypothetical protein